MYDSGGDGWQGTTYTVSHTETAANGSDVTSGTLDSGASGVAWLCLSDGCYDLTVSGGSPGRYDQISFEFIDEVGDAFAGTGAPFYDQFCVAWGDVYNHPTTSPTVMFAPIPAPTTSMPLPYPTVTVTSIPLPTSATLPAPTSTPTSGPSSADTVDVDLKLSLAGVSCADYGDEEEACVNTALAAHIAGQPSFSAHACTDLARRRALLSAGEVELTTTATVTTAAYDDDDVQSSMSASVSSAVESGALASDIMSGGVASLASVSVTGVSLVETPTPTTSLTTLTLRDDDDGQADEESSTVVVLLIVLVVVVGLLVCAVIAMWLHMRGKLNQQQAMATPVVLDHSAVEIEMATVAVVPNAVEVVVSDELLPNAPHHAGSRSYGGDSVTTTDFEKRTYYL